MRIAQIILPNASEYEKKSQRVDHDMLAELHEVMVLDIRHVTPAGAQIAHVYAGGELPAALFRRFPVRYVANVDSATSRWPFGRPTPPDYLVSPIAETSAGDRIQLLPEAVGDAYFERDPRHGSSTMGAIVGSFSRRDANAIMEQTLHRIRRFRDDVTWKTFERQPTPSDLAGVDVWVDAAVSETDYGGYVAEALVFGLPVVASRTPINEVRLERGRTGFLVPPRDANEMTHAILTALFKREAAENRQLAARQTASKFRARQRVRVLTHMYETLIP